MTKTNPKTIDEILAGVSAEQRAVLEKLRRTIHAAAPRAEECISYGLAAFRLKGRPLVALGARPNHCAFYPMSSTTVGMFQKELKDFETSKGTIRFTIDKPLSAALVKKLVKARMAENEETTGPVKRKNRNGSSAVTAAPHRGALRSAGLRPASIERNFPPGVPRPALRALAAAGYRRLGDLTEVTEADLLKLHGIGQKAIAIFRAGLEENGLSFKP